jgi:hypothetical protein
VGYKENNFIFHLEIKNNYVILNLPDEQQRQK